ncbi:hypothetical protein TRIUR3_18723 [Triticum urartu]|uniref:Uncharacterized protein n=1 Tax=Triticum urartu TaxID=4572 RepID=M8A5S6_TRIUA|nr:hypothetical protein TRIUR3_18723 [Triticum urartu]
MGIPIRSLLVASLVLSSIALHVAAKTLDPYKVLGVDKNASQRDIKKAFHKGQSYSSGNAITYALLDGNKQSAFLSSFDKSGYKSSDKLLLAYKPRRGRFAVYKGEVSMEEAESRVLRARRVTDGGKKGGRKRSGLPEAPSNLLDDTKRGMPKDGWTFDWLAALPVGTDVLIVAASFGIITTVMFGTTYLVWKLGAIHFNEY